MIFEKLKPVNQWMPFRVFTDPPSPDVLARTNGNSQPLSKPLQNKHIICFLYQKKCIIFCQIQYQINTKCLYCMQTRHAYVFKYNPAFVSLLHINKGHED